MSRSALIRKLLEEALRDEREIDVSRRILEGYRRVPQATADDAWGDLDRWTETNTRRNRAALTDEEIAPW